MYEVEFKNKNLVITDPCYLDNMMNDNNLTDELKNYWPKFCRNLHSDLADISRFGFNNGFACGTIYGDWSCSIYYVDFDPRDIKTFEDFKKVYDDIILNNKCFGKFCADAGMVCVLDSEEVQKFNPYFFEWAMYHNWCVAGVHNFNGTVGVIDFVDEESKYKETHRILYGIADKEANPNARNFIAMQTGL